MAATEYDVFEGLVQVFKTEVLSACGISDDQLNNFFIRKDERSNTIVLQFDWRMGEVEHSELRRVVLSQEQYNEFFTKQTFQEVYNAVATEDAIEGRADDYNVMWFLILKLKYNQDDFNIFVNKINDDLFQYQELAKASCCRLGMSKDREQSISNLLNLNEEQQKNVQKEEISPIHGMALVALQTAVTIAQVEYEQSTHRYKKTKSRFLDVFNDEKKSQSHSVREPLLTAFFTPLGNLEHVRQACKILGRVEAALVTYLQCRDKSAAGTGAIEKIKEAMSTLREALVQGEDVKTACQAFLTTVEGIVKDTHQLHLTTRGFWGKLFNTESRIVAQLCKNLGYDMTKDDPEQGRAALLTRHGMN